MRVTRAIRILRLVVFIGLAFLFRPSSALASSAASPPNPSILACRTAFLAEPSNYDAARCFLVLPKSVKQEDILREVEHLLAEHPGSINLAIAQQFLTGRPRDYATKRSKLENLLHRATQARDARAQVCVLAHLQLLSNRHGKTEDEFENVERLKAIESTSNDYVAVSHARALVLDARNRQELDVGRSANLLAMPSAEQERLPYYVLRTLLRVRAESSRLAGRFESATRDFEALELAALARRDWITHSMASLGRALLLYDQVHVLPTEIGFKAVKSAFEKARESAKRSGAKGTRVMALYHLGVLQNRASTDSNRLRSTIRECVSLATEYEDKYNLGLCYANQSQMLSSSSPELALLKAVDSLEALDDAIPTGGHIIAWRQVARRLWQIGGKERALPVALSILNTIEELRLSQSASLDRIRRQAAWAMDYYWTISRLVETPGNKDQDLDLVLALGERLRGRELTEPTANSGDFRNIQGRSSHAVDSRQRLARYTQLLRKFANEKNGDTPLANIEQSLEDAERELLKRSDTMHQTIDASVSIASVQEVLHPDESIVVFYAIPSQGIDGEHIGKPGFLLLTPDVAKWVALDTNREEVRSLAAAQRDASRRNASFLTSVNRRIRDEALAPLMRELSPQTKRLVISADGPFHSVAFETLFQGRVSVSRTPSIAFWHRARARPESTDSLKPQPLVIANPDYGSEDQSEHRSARLERLVRSLDEAESIPGALRTSTRLLSGSEATRSKLLSEWNPTRRLIHIAAHSKANLRNPWASYIALAPDQTGEPMSALSWTEIQSMDFSGSVVVLSGCSTASGAVVNGEGIQSLARMFLQSNASAVVSSLWDVRDDEASVYFRDFYNCVGTGETIGSCITVARKQALSRQDWSASTAGFILVGDPSLVLVPTRGSDIQKLWWILITLLLGIGVYIFKRASGR